MCLAGRQRVLRLRPRLAKQAEGVAQRVQRVDVRNSDDVPAVTGEAGGHVLAEAQVSVALDGDVIVVVDPTEVREFEVSGQRSGLAADTLHQIAVAAHRINVEVEQIEVRPVVSRGQPAGGDCHSHAVADPLAKRAGGGLHAAGMSELGMTGATAVQLPKLAQVVQRNRRLAGRPAGGVQLLYPRQVQRGVEQRRGVSAGKDEPIAVGPDGLVWIVAEHFIEKHVGRRGQGHGCAGVPAAGRLDSVHREGPNSVDRQLFD